MKDWPEAKHARFEGFQTCLQKTENLSPCKEFKIKRVSLTDVSWWEMAQNHFHLAQVMVWRKWLPRSYSTRPSYILPMGAKVRQQMLVSAPGDDTVIQDRERGLDKLVTPSGWSTSSSWSHFCCTLANITFCLALHRFTTHWQGLIIIDSHV